ncbi:MAG: HNH endonuclease signature motif containing protein [Terracidiphilus sp.]
MSGILSGVERIAIWTAHSKRCAYCEEPLKYADLEIDHIIPRSLRNKPQELQNLFAQLSLHANFNLDSIDNLLPAHGGCNIRKKARVFSQANARFFLEIAQGKIGTVRSLIPQLEIESSREKLLALVEAALQSGNTDLGELTEAAIKTSRFPLNATVEFESGIWEVKADPEKIEKLLDELVVLDVRGSKEGVLFTDGKGSEISVRTCREYKFAITAGYYPSNNMELKASFILATVSATLEAASHAKLAPISYIRSPRLGVTDLNLLPGKLAPTWRMDGSEIFPVSDTDSIQTLFEKGSISAQISSDARITIECEDHGVTLTELMRADFDYDGVEEILVQMHFYIKGATFRHLSIGLLRRRNPDLMFEYQSWDADWPRAQSRHQIARIMR